jgi:hypothetical protein
MHRGIAVLAVGFVGVLGLAGCTPAQSGYDDRASLYSAFQREPDALDTPPEGIEDSGLIRTPSDVRYIGEHNDTDLWLIASGEEGTAEFCLSVDSHSVGLSTACGGTGSMWIQGGDGPIYHLVPNGSAAPEGATQIFDNVYVEE